MNPKPQKGARKERKEYVSNALKEYRREQFAIAAQRDGGWCVFCRIIDERFMPMDDVHHVFGHGTTERSPKEHFTSLICVCRKHHPQPISCGGVDEKDIRVRMWRSANLYPHNKAFKEIIADEENRGLLDTWQSGEPEKQA